MRPERGPEPLGSPGDPLVLALVNQLFPATFNRVLCPYFRTIQV